MSSLRQSLLLDILTWEDRLYRLALKTYRLWLPAVQDAVLPTLTAAMTLPPDPAAINLTQQVWEESLDKVFMSGMSDMLTRKLGVQVDAGPAVVEADSGITEWRSTYLQDVRNRMVNTPESVFRDISAEVDLGIQEGDTTADLRDRVEKQLRNTGTAAWKGRAETVARTESAGAYNATTLEGAKLHQRLAGEDTELHQVWVSTLDSKTRRSHAAADGQRTTLGGTFRVGRTELRYPGDPRAPAAETINCRCAVSVLSAGDELPSEKSRPGKRMLREWADKGIIRARDDEDGIGVASAAPRKDDTMAELRTFNALLMPLGVPGRSGFFLVSESFKLEDTAAPLALKWQRTDDPGHDGAFTVGAIEEFEIRDGGLWGSGVMLNSAEADEAIEQIEAGVTQPSTEMVVHLAVATDKDGNTLTDEQAEEAFWNDEPILMRWDSGELVGATLVSVPEFRETSITLGDPVDRDTEPLQLALAASAAAVHPYEDVYRKSAFEVPEAEELTDIHVDPDGTVSGHLFPWGTCHMGVKGHCATAYHSESGYAYFHQSRVRLDSGDALRVGRLTVGGGHGPVGEGMGPALEHYDNVSTCWALVRATEGELGLWVSGMVNKQAPAEMVKQAVAAPHSAHWERVAGVPELIAGHAVNTPGFPLITKRSDRQGDLGLVASLFPHRKRTAYDTSILTEVVTMALNKYRQEESRRTEALSLVASAQSRRRARARRLVEGKR